jgi:hypothetical protein
MAYGSFNAGPGKAPDEDVVRTNQIGVPGGIATLDADGHLTESQRPAVDAYTKAETDQRISAAVDAHNGAENAHSDIRASVAAMNASIKAIELKFGTNVTKNPGSPPRVRGKGIVHVFVPEKLGITPAYAGKSPA